MNKAGLNVGLSITLFPIVILTMTIERMSIIWDELGAKDAIRAGAGSLLCAMIAYLAISSPQVIHLSFAFPELLLVVLGVTIMIGRYNGYKLVEFYRFRMLAGKR